MTLETLVTRYKAYNFIPYCTKVLFIGANLVIVKPNIPASEKYNAIDIQFRVFERVAVKHLLKF